MVAGPGNVALAESMALRELLSESCSPTRPQYYSPLGEELAFHSCARPP